jgi:solute carrier family 44 (choline transporter-like protein), member 2/4/5
MECPLPTEDGVHFVCDYPDGDIHLSVDDWIIGTMKMGSKTI